MQREHPPSWSPRHGSPHELLGRLLEVRDVSSTGPKLRVATLLTADGLRSVWIDPPTLRSAWRDASPQPGDTVSIGYLGERLTRDGKRTYGIYACAVVTRVTSPAPDAENER